MDGEDTAEVCLPRSGTLTRKFSVKKFKNRSVEVGDGHIWIFLFLFSLLHGTFRRQREDTWKRRKVKVTEDYLCHYNYRFGHLLCSPPVSPNWFFTKLHAFFNSFLNFFFRHFRSATPPELS